jgi:3D (Asp-Asp-Asp) domain-containing protein
MTTRLLLTARVEGRGDTTATRRVLRAPRRGTRFLLRFALAVFVAVQMYCAAWLLPDPALPPVAPVEVGWVFRPAPPPRAPAVHIVEATAYCHCPVCCGQWADGWTASGTRATAGRTLAADPGVFPIGTCLAFPDGPRVVEDTGSAIVGPRIDIYFGTHHEALVFGRKILALTTC